MNMLKGIGICFSELGLFLVFYWGITVPLFLLLLISSLRNFPFSPKNFKFPHLIILSPFLVPITLLITGGIFYREASQAIVAPNAPRWQPLLIYFIAFLHLPLIFVSYQRMKDYFFFAVFLVLVQFWLTGLAWFVAGMAITGGYV